MAGPDPSRGDGERREAAIRHRRYLVIGALFAAGLVTGLYAGFREGSALFEGGDGAWPPAVALAMIGLFLVAMIGGTIVMQGVMDEHEREHQGGGDDVRREPELEQLVQVDERVHPPERHRRLDGFEQELARLGVEAARLGLVGLARGGE